MKKEIINLIESEEGSFRINNICVLRRWTKDGIGNTVDKLKLDFDTVNGVSFNYFNIERNGSEINSRTYEGIVKEIEIMMKEHLYKISEELCENLYAGYRNKED